MAPSPAQSTVGQSRTQSREVAEYLDVAGRYLLGLSRDTGTGPGLRRILRRHARRARQLAAGLRKS
jgi:hypothetical protein